MTPHPIVAVSESFNPPSVIAAMRAEARASLIRTRREAEEARRKEAVMMREHMRAFATDPTTVK